MSFSEGAFMRDDPLILLDRFAEYVRPHPAKVLARMIGCTESTAENFRLGRSWPTARHWRLIVRHFGRDVLQAVFEPEIDVVLARLTMEERQLEEALNDIRARRRAAAGPVEGPEERREPDTDRALEPVRDLFEEAR